MESTPRQQVSLLVARCALQGRTRVPIRTVSTLATFAPGTILQRTTAQRRAHRVRSPPLRSPGTRRAGAQQVARWFREHASHAKAHKSVPVASRRVRYAPTDSTHRMQNHVSRAPPVWLVTAQEGASIVSREHTRQTPVQPYAPRALPEHTYPRKRARRVKIAPLANSPAFLRRRYAPIAPTARGSRRVGITLARACVPLERCR